MNRKAIIQELARKKSERYRNQPTVWEYVSWRLFIRKFTTEQLMVGLVVLNKQVLERKIMFGYS